MHTLISEFSREVLAAGVAVFQVGDTGDSAYVIESGCVEVLVGAAPASGCCNAPPPTGPRCAQPVWLAPRGAPF